jgi:acetyltransferase
MDIVSASGVGPPYPWLPRPWGGTAGAGGVVLANGRHALIRPVVPGDAASLREFVQRLSPQSRYRRFHGAMATVPDAMLQYLTDVDHDDHVALLAEARDASDSLKQVAEARFVRRTGNADRSQADLAVAVADDWQRAGLGRCLLRWLAREADRVGIARLHAEVLADNRPMRELLGSLGWRLRSDRHDPRLVSGTLDVPMLSRLADPVGTDFMPRNGDERTVQ